jgi:ABC-type multidrug transport system ATPase subunit
MEQSQKVIFPKVRKVRLERFSLFSLAPNIELDVRDGVFCLAGANGLGKSTFLAAVNYGITGIVADPDREFKSVEDYYKYSIGYSDKFFQERFQSRIGKLPQSPSICILAILSILSQEAYLSQMS